MTHGRWTRYVDGRRALSLVFGVAGTVLFVLGFAAAPVPLGPNGSSLVFLGASLGIATRGYLDHRRAGRGDGLRWALAYGGGMLLFFIVFLVVAAAIRPIVAGNATLTDAWMALVAGGLPLGAICAIVWERNPRRQRIDALLFLALGLLLGGLVAATQGDPWTALGVVGIPAGFLALLVALVQSILEGDRERAARAA